MTLHLHLRDQLPPARMKLVASVLLAVPAGVLLLFAVGEMASGEISGVQHIPEALLLVVLAAAAWRYPRWTGIALLTIGTLLLATWLVWIFAGGHVDRGSIAMWFVAALVLFGPPLAAGWLLLRATRGIS